MLVELEVTERITYRRVIEMSEWEYKRMLNDLDNGSRKESDRAAEDLRCRIYPPTDFLDADILQIETFRPVDGGAAPSEYVREGSKG